MTEGPEFAAAEWMSGWIALSFLNDALLAEEHFLNFYNNVSYPISISRGAYWLGKTYEKLGDKEKSDKWFMEGAKYLTTYYGQLSHMKIYPNKLFELNKFPSYDNYELGGGIQSHGEELNINQVHNIIKNMKRIKFNTAKELGYI